MTGRDETIRTSHLKSISKSLSLPPAHQYPAGNQRDGQCPPNMWLAEFGTSVSGCICGRHPRDTRARPLLRSLLFVAVYCCLLLLAAGNGLLHASC